MTHLVYCSTIEIPSFGWAGLGWPRVAVAPGGLGWPQVASGGLGWPQVAPSGLLWPQVAWGGLSCARFGSTWLEL